MNIKELMEYIDDLHHNRDYYSRSKLLELIKHKINSLAQRENSNVSDNETKKKLCPLCAIDLWYNKVMNHWECINHQCDYWTK